MGSGSPQQGQQMSQASGGQFTPVNQNNAQQVGQQAFNGLQQGNPMGAAMLPLEGIFGMAGFGPQTSNQPVNMGNQPLSDSAGGDGQTANQPTNMDSSGQASNTPISNVVAQTPSISSVLGGQGSDGQANSGGMNINQFVNQDGTAAPLSGTPNFVTQQSQPLWSNSPNSFSGSINGVPWTNGAPVGQGMLSQQPPTANT